MTAVVGKGCEQCGELGAAYGTEDELKPLQRASTFLMPRLDLTGRRECVDDPSHATTTPESFVWTHNCKFGVIWPAEKFPCMHASNRLFGAVTHFALLPLVWRLSYLSTAPLLPAHPTPRLALCRSRVSPSVII